MKSKKAYAKRKQDGANAAHVMEMSSSKQKKRGNKLK